MAAMFRGKMSMKEIDQQMLNVQNKNRYILFLFLIPFGRKVFVFLLADAPGIDVKGCERVKFGLPREKSRVRFPPRNLTNTAGFKITEEGNALSGKRLHLHLARIKVEMTDPSQRLRHGTYKQWSREQFKMALRAQFIDA